MYEEMAEIQLFRLKVASVRCQGADWIIRVLLYVGALLLIFSSSLSRMDAPASYCRGCAPSFGLISLSTVASMKCVGTMY